MTQAKTQTSALTCSFCHKSEDSVAKLISSPSDYPRAYICDECIAVCASVLEDDHLAARSGAPVTDGEKHPLLAHPLGSALMTAVERWIRQESLTGDGSEELAEVRRIAMEMMDE